MQKTTAVIDKSVFQRVCEEPAAERERYFNALLARYQLIVPAVLIEEVLVNLVEPGDKDPLAIEEMVAKLIELRSCWMDDVHEIAFRELVNKEVITKFPAPSDEFLEGLFSLKRNDPELLNSIEKRKADKKEDVGQWKLGQLKLTPNTQLKKVDSGKSFFGRIILPVFARNMDDSAMRRELLDEILGKPFRRLHPDSGKKIDEAFGQYNSQSFTRFPRTHDCLIARLCYYLAPTAIIVSPTEPRGRKIIKGGEQTNSVQDEHYVIAALMCDRLLTGDFGMRSIIQVFRDIGRWRGRTIFFDPNEDLASQIPQLLA